MKGTRKSTNVEDRIPAKGPTTRPEHPGQYTGPFRHPKSSRFTPGGAEARSQSLMGNSQSSAMEGAAERDRATAKRSLPRKDANPFAKARSR